MEVVSHQISSVEVKNNKLAYSSQEIPHKEADLKPWTPGFYAHKNIHSSFISLSYLRHWGLRDRIQVQCFRNSWWWQSTHHIILSHKRVPDKFLSIYKLRKELVLLQLPKILPGSIQNPGWLKTSHCRFLQLMVEKWAGESRFFHNVSWTQFSVAEPPKKSF